MTTTLQQWANSQSNPELTVNENFASLAHAGCYAMRPAATAGLTWAYYGGRWGGQVVADGTITLTASTTHYITVARATGVISASTATTAWNNWRDNARVYKLTTGASTVTAVEDHRSGPGGVHGPLAVLCGTATLVAGVATVSNTAVAADSNIQLTPQSAGGTPGWLRVSARTAGTSFTITSSSNTDTSVVGWVLHI